MATLYEDTFQRANNASSWGNASDKGGAWNHRTGTSTLAISSNRGTVTGVAGTDQVTLVGTLTDGEVVFRTSTSATMADRVHALLRRSSSNTYYMLGFNTDTTIEIKKNVSGTITSLTSATVSAVGTTVIWIRARIQGSAPATLQFKYWNDGTTEPVAWNLTTTDSSIASGEFGVHSQLSLAADVVSYDHFYANDLTWALGASGDQLQDANDKLTCSDTWSETTASTLNDSGDILSCGEGLPNFIQVNLLGDNGDSLSALDLVLSPTINFIPTTVIDRDTFIRSNQSGGFGIASDGIPWTSRGNATAQNIISNQGVFTGASGSSFATFGSKSILDVEILVRVKMVNALADNVGPIYRYQDTNNFIRTYLNSTVFIIQKKLASVNSIIATMPFAPVIGQYYWIRTRTQGTNYYASCWLDGTIEPPEWMISGTDSTTYNNNFFGMWGNMPNATDQAVFDNVTIINPNNFAYALDQTSSESLSVTATDVLAASETALLFAFYPLTATDSLTCIDTFVAQPLYVPVDASYDRSQAINIFNVVNPVLTNEHTNGWNTNAVRKIPHTANYTPNVGGMYINWLENINWASYDQYTQINQSTPSGNQVAHGYDQRYSHDDQICLQYLHAVALYLNAYPTDSSFVGPNGSGYLALSAMVDHISLGDFAPATNSTNGGYNNPKGWIGIALKETWLLLKDTALITQSQKDALFSSYAYAMFTYMNDWWDNTVNLFANERHINYQPSQSLLMAYAVQDFAYNYPEYIFPNMYYNSSPFSPQTASAWLVAGQLGVTNVLNRGCITPYNLTYGVMNINASSSTDIIGNAVVKSDDVSEFVEGLCYLASMLNDSYYLSLADTIINAIDTYMLDTNNGGYYANFNNSTGVTNNAYKECRATAHMLAAYHLYNQIKPIYTAREASILNTLLTKMFKTTASGSGFYYRVLPDASFGAYTDTYIPAWSSTLAANVNIGDTSVQVNSAPSKNSTTCNQSILPGDNIITPVSMTGINLGDNLLIDTGPNIENVTVLNIFTDNSNNPISFEAVFILAHTAPWTIATFDSSAIILDYGGAQEEEIILDCQNTTGTVAPFTVPVNANVNGGTGQFQKTHTLGAPIRTMLYPMSLFENFYTTEAMSNISVYLLKEIVQPVWLAIADSLQIVMSESLSDLAISSDVLGFMPNTSMLGTNTIGIDSITPTLIELISDALNASGDLIQNSQITLPTDSATISEILSQTLAVAAGDALSASDLALQSTLASLISDLVTALESLVSTEAASMADISLALQELYIPTSVLNQPDSVTANDVSTLTEITIMTDVVQTQDGYISTTIALPIDIITSAELFSPSAVLATVETLSITETIQQTFVTLLSDLVTVVDGAPNFISQSLWSDTLTGSDLFNPGVSPTQADQVSHVELLVSTLTEVLSEIINATDGIVALTANTFLADQGTVSDKNGSGSGINAVDQLTEQLISLAITIAQVYPYEFVWPIDASTMTEVFNTIDALSASDLNLSNIYPLIQTAANSVIGSVLDGKITGTTPDGKAIGTILDNNTVGILS